VGDRESSLTEVTEAAAREGRLRWGGGLPFCILLYKNNKSSPLRFTLYSYQHSSDTVIYTTQSLHAPY
jgi:hypothetical protein